MYYFMIKRVLIYKKVCYIKYVEAIRHNTSNIDSMSVVYCWWVMLMTGESPSSTLERGWIDFIESIHVGVGVLPHYLLNACSKGQALFLFV